jgi:hypothetical protein
MADDLAAIGVDLPVATGPEPELIALIETPRGPVILR